MSSRIITKGLQPGGSTDGVKFILTRGLSSMLVNSRRQRIVDRIKVLLATINTSNGFRTCVGDNLFEWKTFDFQDTELPGIDVRDTSETVNVVGGRHFYTLLIEIEAKVSASTSTQKGRHVLADIIKLMGQNFNLNNLAHKITPVENELLDFEQGNKKQGTVLIKFEVEYATKAFQPYS